MGNAQVRLPAPSLSVKQEMGDGDSLLEEVREQPLALLSQETLGVVLDTLHGPGLVTDAHDIVAYAPFPRSAGAGGDDNVRRPQLVDLLDRYLVVAKDLDVAARPYLAQLLHQVVGE